MEKTFLNKALVGAIALTGAVAFTACSSSDEPGDAPSVTSETVKTQFSISLPANAVGKTRASVETVQGQTSPVFRGMTGIVLVPYGVAPVTGAATRIGDNITLGDISTSELGEKSNAKLYKDVNIPIGTTGFLFYGRANDGSVTTAAQKFQYGVLNASALTGENPTFTFTPEQISTATTADAKATKIAEYLTSIANATGWSATTNAGMKALYDKFISLTAGSSANVLAAVQGLYTSLGTNTDALSVAIRTAIKNDTYVTETSGNLTLKDNLTGYPKNINLPDGAAAVKWSGTAFVADPAATQTYGGIQIAKQSNYVYMPNLYYTVNTAVKTMEGDQEPLYNATNTWDQILAGFITPSTAVTSTTHSVALVNKIQYAVGRLDTKVSLAGTTLYDRNGEAVTVNDNSFPVTAVLIGGQKAVGYDFTPKGSEEFTVYDNAVKSGTTAKAAGSDLNYTLALETPANIPVNVAVELENKTGHDFQGVNGVIPAGSKFYLIAQLKPAEGTGATGGTAINQVFKQDYVTTANLTIKPGTEKDGTPAFSNNVGLGNAYNVIPDLRTPKLSLGLSVDLTWQAGLTFNVDL